MITIVALKINQRLSAALTLVAAVEARDSYTAEHSNQVVDLAAEVAENLGHSEDEVHELRLVAALHDIGKIATPDSILRKEGPLSTREWEVMRQHPVEGEKLISQSPGVEHLAPMIRAEHERWDGSGYELRRGKGRDQVLPRHAIRS